MKKTLIFFIILNVSFAFGQDVPYESVKSTIETLDLKGLGNINIKDVRGSAYANDQYQIAIPAENYKSILARYNNFKDQIEFKREGNTYILPKDTTFRIIKFTQTKETLVYFTQSESESEGYYYEIYSGKKISFYKKAVITYQPAQESSNSYNQSKSASFSKPKVTYYMKKNSVLQKLPKNSKDFVKEFAGIESNLNEFIKAKKVKLDNDADINNLGMFLEGIL